jgi:hypothetical protein
MIDIFSPTISPARRKFFFAALALIILMGWIKGYYDQQALNRQRELFAAEIRSRMDTGIVTARFLTNHFPDQRKPCFVADDRKTTQFIATAIAQADTTAYLVPTQHVMEFTVDLAFADGGAVTLEGKVVETARRDVYLAPSQYKRDGNEIWQPGPLHKPVRIPDFADWLQGKFVEHGCALL